MILISKERQVTRFIHCEGNVTNTLPTHHFEVCFEPAQQKPVVRCERTLQKAIEKVTL